MSETLQEIRLADYRSYAYKLKSTELKFELGADGTDVETVLSLRREDTNETDLYLDGINLELISIEIDGRSLSGNEYSQDSAGLTIYQVPPECILTTRVRIHPEKNTELEGLYKSNKLFCTQCEAEGFRKITYYPDRPDVQTEFTTTILADPDLYPVMLSNGNCVDDRILDDGRRSVTWNDPFNKPSYLFALVAGDLAVKRDQFRTRSGREIKLEIYSEAHNIEQCDYAMEALKRAMAWDEDVYGREYDLDIFMIVAVEDFNMGAMENKGLNVFNTSCVLATPDTATDAAYLRVEGVVAHEYFHNWSGNRVTCRDWFQLSLKEGFTVFRDSQFSADMNSKTVKRIEDVDFLRTTQFIEDQGPLAHPIRPESYVEISNFYTTTIYEKGAEVVGMLHTLLGAKRFREATDLYFDKHDGSAATTEDFVLAMEEKSDLDLQQFRHWYSQAGTPVLNIEEKRTGSTLCLTIKQTCPPTPEQINKENFHMPIAFGLIDEQGSELLGKPTRNSDSSVVIETDLHLENPNNDGTLIAHLKSSEATIELKDAPRNSEVSFLRGFSAPVIINYKRSLKSRLSIAINDSDGYCRWDAAQSILIDVLANESADFEDALSLFDKLTTLAIKSENDGESPAVLAISSELPRALSVLQVYQGRDIEELLRRRDELHGAIGRSFLERWKTIAASNTIDVYEPDPKSIARRSLKNISLDYFIFGLQVIGDPIDEFILDRFDSSNNLTDRLAAFVSALEAYSIDETTRRSIIDRFYSESQKEALVVDKWLASQASAQRPGGLERVKGLEVSPVFDMGNPNKVRSLLGAFAMYNERNFHDLGGSGYRYLADKVLELDTKNPQIAAKLAKNLTGWTAFDSNRQQMMRDELSRIRETANSLDVLEIVTKSQ
jgi:aminopeptidase N